LLWCQKKTEGYAHVKVENFTTSFQNGLAFCALIHRHRPDLLEYDGLSPDDARGNLELAFRVADESLGITRLLDIEDLVDVARPDERSVMTYVSMYFHCFASQNQQEIAGRRIAKVVKLTQTNDQLKTEYSGKAEALASWISAKTAELEDRSFDNTLDGVRDLLLEYSNYRKNIKPEKTAELLAVEQQYNNIALKLRANNRPDFEPAAGTSVKELHAAWEGLEKAEADRGVALRAELDRQERLQILVRRFNNKASVFSEWANTKKHLLSSLENEKFTTVGQVAARTQMLDAYDNEVANAKERLEVLEKLADDITGDNYRDSEAVVAKRDEVRALYQSLGSLSRERRETLGSELVLQEKQEDLRKEFARQAKDFDRWIKDSSENARDTTNFGESLDEVTNYRDELESTESQVLATSADKKAALDKVDADLKAAGVTYNAYTSLSVADIEERQANLASLLADRRAAYATELARQQAMEEKRKEFAAAAQAFVDYLADEKTQINGVEGEPEECIANIRSLHNEQKGGDSLAELKALDSQMRDMGIVYNHHTKLSYPGLTSRWNAHKAFVSNFIETLEQDAVLNRRAQDTAAEWKKAQHDEEMRNEFAKRSGALVAWMQGANETLSEPIVANSPEDVQKLQEQFDAVYSELPARTAEKDSINAYSQELAAAGITENPLAELTIDELNSRFADVEAALNARKSGLEAEAERQARNDELARKFAQEAQEVSDMIDGKLAQLQALAGSVEAQLEGLNAISLDQTPVDNLFATDSQVHDAEIRYNRHTALTAEAIGAKWTALNDSVTEKRKLLESELSAQTHGELPAEQLAEIQECFRKFDKDSTGGLARHEFKACLSALGEDISEAALDALWDGNHNANNEIEMEAFTNFVVSRLKDTDSEQQIVESFRALAGDRPFITESELKVAFREPAELEYILANMPPAAGVEGGYDYVAYTKSIFSR
jgi:Ca2+-binding EF-hand superfamily protein